MNARTLLSLLVTMVLPICAKADVTLDQVISREAPAFGVRQARLSVGQDGMVYLNATGTPGYILRVSRDGQDRFGSVAVYAMANATANADGVVASANGHFAHKVVIYDRQLREQAEATDFLVNDQVGWDAPIHIEAGPSGDFYALDQHRDRIVRLNASGKVLRAYPFEHLPGASIVQDFRVCEKTEALYLFPRGLPMRCIGFDGKLRWTTAINATPSNPWDIGGGYDVDPQGILHVISAAADTVRRFSPEGKPLAPIVLKMGERKPASGEGGFVDLRVWKGQVVLRRRHDTELFQVYDLEGGVFRHAEHSMHDRLRVTYPADVWTAGETIPFRISLSAGGKEASPRWRVWGRTPGTVDYRPFAIAEGKLTVPADAAGMMQLKVSPELQPWQQGEASEYRLDAWVEIRRPGSTGTATVLTPSNRVSFGRGEEIPFSVLIRTSAPGPVDFTVRLTEGTHILAEGRGTAPAAVRTQTFVLPSTLTGALRPGAYLLSVDANGLTCAAQPLEIGPGLRTKRTFHVVQYGDYGETYPTVASVWDAADLSAAQIARSERLGINLFVDRLGIDQQYGSLTLDRLRGGWEGVAKRLAADANAAPPERVFVTPPLIQSLGRQSSRGLEQMAILMNNDAGLPLGGPGFDGRKPEQILSDLTKVTKAMQPYSAFRGWTWASNWWVFEARGAKAGISPEEQNAYNAALKKAKETGVWDPVLDTVANRRLDYAVTAQKLFNDRLKELAPGLVTASACPYRNVEAYPPTTLSNVDEVDLQAQWEQLPLPYYLPNSVDFYKRPGKRAWCHPEIWNDAGTGDQVIPSTFDAIMRGADGVGFSGRVPSWGDHPGDKGEDGRLAYFGMPSVYRATNEVLRQYGPWFTTLHDDDRVAIVVSGRLMRIDNWVNVTGQYFARLLEAYATCLHAHHPARFAFAEDLDPDSLLRYKAVLVVGQTVEFEPRLATALDKAKAAGVVVFHDASCRPNIVKGFTPLGVSFTKFEKDAHPASDDSAFWRFRDYCLANLPAVSEKLNGAAEPAAKVDAPEVFVSARQAEQGRYLFVVNNTTTTLDPGQLWRVTLNVASRVPLEIPVGIHADKGVVYDVFAGRRVEPEKGMVRADLRSLPARVFAALPAAMARVELRGPGRIGAGERFAWTATVQDSTGKVIPASIPLRIRLLAADGKVIEEWCTAAGSKGAGGTSTVPVNVVDGKLTLEAVELITGLSTRLAIETTPPVAAARLTSKAEPQAERPVVPASAVRQGAERVDIVPAEQRFGPHVRDLIVTSGGQAIMNTMNWDHNLYAVDIKTGATTWRQRAGQYFAFEPQAIAKGFVVQGFQFDTASGYGLYLAKEDGTLERRFDLFGVPGRLPHRFVPGLLRDQTNHFAVSPDGQWVASAGDLGLAVWSREGKLYWSRETWQQGRESPLLLAPDARTLLVVNRLTIAAVDPGNGKPIWSTTLARTGEVRKVVTSADGKTVCVLATTDGGRLYVLRDGKLAATIAAAGDDIALSPDSSRAAVIGHNQLKLYSLESGPAYPLWVLPADDTLHFPRFAVDGKRVAVCSELGTVYVVDVAGRVLLERDNAALTVPAWLPDGDLLLANWMGSVCRLDKDYAERWRSRLEPAETDMRGKQLALDRAPVTRIAHWGNAEAQPAALTPNLLEETSALIRFVGSQNHLQFERDPLPLISGKPVAPKAPWLSWSLISDMAETSPTNHILFDTGRTFVRATGITFVEDEAHPESWLRDAGFEYWDAEKERWFAVQPLLSDAAVHTHRFAKPVEASRFRVTLPWGLCGNLRLQQIVLHGEKIGPTHPDARARRAVAVLFDEGNDLRETLVQDHNGLSFRFEGAFSGGRCLQVQGDKLIGPAYQPRFGGHAIPNWDFEITEQPEPGAYRYLQFAWRASDPKTRGIVLELGPMEYGRIIAVNCGEYKARDGVMPLQWKAEVPRDWQVVRIDLWKVFKKPVRIRHLGLGAVGGAARFDQILLGRSEKDLDAYGK